MRRVRAILVCLLVLLQGNFSWAHHVDELFLVPSHHDSDADAAGAVADQGDDEADPDHYPAGPASHDPSDHHGHRFADPHDLTRDGAQSTPDLTPSVACFSARLELPAVEPARLLASVAAPWQPPPPAATRSLPLLI